MSSNQLRSSPAMRAQAERFAKWRKPAQDSERASAIARVADHLARDEAKKAARGDLQAGATQPLPPGAPTPERTAKAAHGVSSDAAGKGEMIPLRRYVVRTSVDSVRGHFEVEEVEAMAQFVLDAELVTRVNVTARYEGFTTRGAGHSRMGGLGNVTDDVRARHAHHEMVKRKLGPRLLEVAAWLLLEVRAERLGRSLTLSEVGHQVFPQLKDKATTRGIALGLLKSLAWRLVQIERYERALSRSPSEPRRILSVMSEPKR